MCWDVTVEGLAAGRGWLRSEDRAQEIGLLAVRLANESQKSILLWREKKTRRRFKDSCWAKKTLIVNHELMPAFKAVPALSCPGSPWVSSTVKGLSGHFNMTGTRYGPPKLPIDVDLPLVFLILTT